MNKLIALLAVAFFIQVPIIWANDAESVPASAKQTDAQFVPGELLVKYKPSVRETTAEYYQAKWGLSTIQSFHTIGVQHVKLSKDMTVKAALKMFQDDSNVMYAEPNYYAYLDAVPNDALFGLLWGMHNTGQNVRGNIGTPDADIDAPEAWDNATGTGSVIAVIDTGVDRHPDLLANFWNNKNEIAGNGIDDDGNGYVDDIRGWDFVFNDNEPNDGHGHGTHVAGIIAAIGNNGIGVTGVAYTAKIMALRIFNASGTTTLALEVAAHLYANAMGAHVINNSWGGEFPSQALQDAIAASPAVVVCSAGNRGLNNDILPHYPSGYPLPNILAVAATDQNDNMAAFSNFGPTTVDVAAPGVNILNTFATVEAGDYGYKTGTSMSTPMVSGVAAMVRNPPVSAALDSSYVSDSVLSNLDIIAKIKETVDPLASLSGRIATGGRINANNAVQSTGGGGGGGCFIATAAFGSPLENHVKILRAFRDRFMRPNTPGRVFIAAYYAFSPAIAEFIDRHNHLRKVVRLTLMPVVGVSWMVLKLDSGVSLLIIALLIFFVGAFVVVLFKKRQLSPHNSL